MSAKDPQSLAEEYQRLTNTHRFDEVAPLISTDALYWFSNGTTHEGMDAIRAVFEHNWSLIRNEEYRLEQIRWLAQDERIAVCVYRFRWEGDTAAGRESGSGRGTSVLLKVNGAWQIVHEHLSREADR